MKCSIIPTLTHCANIMDEAKLHQTGSSQSFHGEWVLSQAVTQLLIPEEDPIKQPTKYSAALPSYVQYP